MLIRMALFALVLGVANEVSRHDEDVAWYTAKRFRKPQPIDEQ